MISGIFNFLNQLTTVSEADFQFLMSKAVVHNFNKREKITDLGAIENRIYYITKGLVRKFFYRDDEEVITQFIKENNLLSCTSSFFSRKPSKYILEALEPTTTFSISFDELEAIFNMGNKWEKTGRIIITHFLLQQEILLMDNIRLTVKERFKKFMNENPDLVQRVPQKQLASYLNIKQETFSRMKHLMYDKSLKTV